MARAKRVLVVEDEALVAMLLEDILRDDFGCQVIGPAAKVETALALVERGGIDFALLDVNLGGSTSFPVAETLRTAGTPFAFVTGYGRAGVRFDLRDAPVLTKPIDEGELARVLGVGIRCREMCAA